MNTREKFIAENSNENLGWCVPYIIRHNGKKVGYAVRKDGDTEYFTLRKKPVRDAHKIALFKRIDEETKYATSYNGYTMTEVCCRQCPFFEECDELDD